MATYFINLSASVNGGGTTREDPYNAMSSLPTLSAGDIVEIEPGSSGVMSAAYTVSGSGTAASWITIRANPAVSGASPRLRVAAAGTGGILISSRSYVRLENLEIYGDESWSHNDTYAVYINGAGSNIVLDNVVAKYARFELAGGFARTDTSLLDCSATDCIQDGLRFWSGTGTYEWNRINIIGGNYSRNGRYLGTNGFGLSVVVQSGHTGTTFSNLTIKDATIVDNYRGGIATNDTSVAWATIIDAANTTPPTRQIRSVVISGNTIQRNGGAGMSVLGVRGGSIQNNLVTDNSTRTTLGNVWTGGCAGLRVVGNTCLVAYSNGTIVGDGCGIFDDQWNDGCLFVGNYIADNVFQATNPEYTALGIGIYRTSNSKHFGNIIKNCRYGILIGYVPGATAPTMAGIIIANNTIIDSTVQGIKIWADTPASALRLSNNAISGCVQPMSADDATAGTQTFEDNIADRCVTESDGANIANGVTFPSGGLLLDASFRPGAGSPALAAGTSIADVVLKDFYGKEITGTPSIGAIQVYPARTAATSRTAATRTTATRTEATRRPQ